MCLALPVKIESILDQDQATVELNGVRTQISTALVDDIQVGDYVILHVGYALSKLDEQEAQRTLQLFEQGEADND